MELTTDQVSQILGIHRSSTLRLVHSGRLVKSSSSTPGRMMFDQDVVDAFKATFRKRERGEQTKPLPEMQTYLPVPEAAEIHGIGESSIYYAIHHDKVRSKKIGRRWFVDPVTLEQWKSGPGGLKAAIKKRVQEMRTRSAKPVQMSMGQPGLLNRLESKMDAITTTLKEVSAKLAQLLT